MSGGDLYRDALLGVRARVVLLVARIADREAQVTRAFWDILPGDVRAELVALRVARDRVGADSLADLADAEGKLEAYLEQVLQERSRVPTPPAADTAERALAFETWAHNHRLTPPLPDDAVRRQNLVRDAR